MFERLAVVVLLATGTVVGQTLSLSSASAPAGISAALNLTLSSGGSSPSGLQWTLTYDPTKVSAVNAVAGPSATSAGKAIECGGAAGALTCLLAGLNQTPIPDGVVAVVNITPAAGASSIAVAIGGVVGASAAGSAIPFSGTGGSVTVSGPSPTTPTTPTSPSAPTVPSGPTSVTSLTNLTCSPAALTSGVAATCTVLLSGLNTSDMLVSLSSNDPNLSVPPSVTVAAGSISASFAASAGSYTVEQAAVVTATLNNQSQSFTFDLAVSVTQQTSPSGMSPAISGIPAGVLDAGSYTANVAAGSIFVVKGSNLSPAGQLQASSYPLSTSLNGVGITFTPAAGGAGINSYMLYTYNVSGTNQLAAVLPSATPPGAYNVAVTNNGVTSAAAPVTVVARKFELISADSSGTGAAALQNQDAAGNYSYNRFTTGQFGSSAGSAYAPAHPGDYVIAYGTGLGPIQAPDNSPPGAVDFSGQVKTEVLVGGKALAPSYAGRSPNYPGMDQINVQLPPDVTTGCTVSFQVSVGGQLSNPATISIAPAGASSCSPALFSSDVLGRLDQGGSLVVGNFLLSQLASTITQAGGFSLAGLNESAFGSFSRYSGFQMASATAFLSPPGSCQVFQTVGDANQLMFGPVGSNLDAGTLVLNGPNIADQSFARDNATLRYSLSLGTAPALPGGLYLPLGFPSFTGNPVIAAGTYELLNSGGRDVGRFMATTSVDPPVKLSAALPTGIDRSQDLTLSWSTAELTDLVAVTGVSGTVVGGATDNPIYQAGTFLCVGSSSAGSITVPSAVLEQIPATPSTNGIGYVQVSSWPQPTSGNGLFTAPLQTGTSIDGGVFLGRTGVFSSTSYK